MNVCSWLRGLITLSVAALMIGCGGSGGSGNTSIIDMEAPIPGGNAPAANAGDAGAGKREPGHAAPSGNEVLLGPEGDGPNR
jgi:hypothetical protein